MSATKFKLWAVKNGLTAQQISDKTGISKATIFCYFQGTRSPNKRTREKLKKIGVNTIKIFGE